LTGTEQSTRVGLFGGSFDPIHLGHVATVRAAQRELGLDRVIYLPTARPPHKPERKFASARSRFAMVEIALLDHEDLQVSPFELTPDRSAYTIDTVRHFQKTQPEVDFVLLIGGDSFAQLDRWKSWNEIVERVRIGVLVRPGWRIEQVSDTMNPELLALAQGGAVDFVEDEPMAVSSTDLRRRFAQDLEIPSDALSPAVLKYVRKYSLYR